MMGWMYQNGYTGHFIGGFIMMLGSFVLIGLILYFIFKNTRGVNYTPTSAPLNPLDILKERYARGEIDTEEFLRRKEELEK